MASSSGSEKFYFGTVGSVISNYGWMHLNDDTPAPKAFFDLTSVGGALDDLTKHFKAGCEVRARIKGVQDKKNDESFKAYAVMLVDQTSAGTRGGDCYLKKYIEDHGPQNLDDLVMNLPSQTDNCPKFLKTCEIADIKQLVLSRLDWFEIYNGDSLYVIPVENNLKITLLNKLKSTPCLDSSAIQDLLSQNKKFSGYTNPVILKSFVSRNPDLFIFWNNAIWKNGGLSTENESQFRKDMLAVNYYSKFVDDSKGVTQINTLRGHFSQADDEVKQSVKPKDTDFRAFLDRNRFFFDLNDDGNIISCPEHRLKVLKAHWHQQLTNQMHHTAATSNSNNVKNGTDTTPSISHASADGNLKSKKKLKDSLISYLVKNGAKTLEVLCEELNTDLKELEKVASEHPSIFSVRNGFFCHKHLEDRVVYEAFQLLNQSHLSQNELNLKLSSVSEIQRYLTGAGSGDAIYDFVSRNPDYFLFWNDAIYIYKQVLENAQQKMCFESEMKAVEYYSQFLKKDCHVPIVSVRGHYAQAPQEVRSAVHSRPEVFSAFLKRNGYFFDMVEMDDTVRINDKQLTRLSLIRKFWLDPEIQEKAMKYIPTLKSKNMKEKSSIQSFPSVEGESTSNVVVMSGAVAQSGTKVENLTTPIQVSRTFDDDTFEMISGKQEGKLFTVSQTKKERCTLINEENCYADVESVPVATKTLSGAEGALNLVHKGFRKVHMHPEAQILLNLIGDEISSALEKETSFDSTLSNLLLLRFTIGKPVKVKFNEKSDMEGRNASLKSKCMESQDLQRILRSENVVKVGTGHHYGIKGTLHSITALEQGEKIQGVTIFCQIHEDSDGLTLNVKKGNKLEVVFTGEYPEKFIYNYLRCKCEKYSNSGSGDVLVIDLNGKLTGCDNEPHRTLGDVFRLQCTDSAELTQAMLKSIPHNHGCVFLVGADSKEHIEAIEKMCTKGMQVFAEVSSHLQNEVKHLLN